MKLISMTDFVLEQETKMKEKDSYEFTFGISERVFKYANFLKQPLKLEMFVPEKSKPTVDAYMQPKKMSKQYDEWFDKYGKKVLFKDFEISTNKEGEKVVLGDYTCLKVSDLENGTIEDLVKYVHIKLTANAIKQLRLCQS